MTRDCEDSIIIGRAMSLADLVEVWSRRMGELAKVALLWQYCPLLAAALASSSWQADVTVQARSWNGPCVATQMCYGLSAALMKQFMGAQVADDLKPADDQLGDDDEHVKKKRTWGMPTYGISHILNRLSLGRRQKNMGDVKACAADGLKFAYGAKAGPHLSRLDQHVDEPITETLSKARVQIDVAPMLQRRWRC